MARGFVDAAWSGAVPPAPPPPPPVDPWARAAGDPGRMVVESRGPNWFEGLLRELARTMMRVGGAARPFTQGFSAPPSPEQLTAAATEPPDIDWAGLAQEFMNSPAIGMTGNIGPLGDAARWMSKLPQSLPPGPWIKHPDFFLGGWLNRLVGGGSGTVP